MYERRKLSNNVERAAFSMQNEVWAVSIYEMM
jgi:hypothetical protein